MTADGTHLLGMVVRYIAILLLRYICSHSCTACAGPCMQYNGVCISVPLGQCLHNNEAKMSPGGESQVRKAIDDCKPFGCLYSSHCHTGALC